MIPIQASFNLLDLTEGTAIILIGLLGLLLTAATLLRNPAALVLWGLSVLSLVFAGVFGIGIELFWLTMMGTVVTLVAGFALRMGVGR